jgi:hypothetical protein
MKQENLKLLLVEEFKEKYLLSNFYKDRSNIKNLHCTKVYSYADYDAQFISGESRCILEAKLRVGRYNFDYLNENGIFIETKKYTKIISIAENKNAIPLYLNYSSDGLIIIHNLHTAKITKTLFNVWIEKSQSYEDRHILSIKNTELYDFDINDELKEYQPVFEQPAIAKGFTNRIQYQSIESILKPSLLAIRNGLCIFE